MASRPLRHARSLLLALLTTFGAGPAQAQWVQDGIGVGTGPGTQNSPAITSDRANGAIIAWRDDRSGTPDIYAQRVDVRGFPRWTANGVVVCGAAATQLNPQLVPDGGGGAIVVWQDQRAGNYDIYVQRIDAGGIPQWTANGVALCTAAGDQTLPQIAADGSGGAIVSWQDQRSGAYAIYAQRVNAAGAPQWTANGVAMCSGTGDQKNPKMIAGTSGDAIVVWEDHRFFNADIFGQRVQGSGALSWASSGSLVCAAANDQVTPRISPDGVGGALVTWEDFRTGDDVYAQRLNAAGVALWSANGVAVCTGSTDVELPSITLDGSGGAYVAWADVRPSIPQTVRGQRLNGTGTPLWTANGIALATGGTQGSPRYPELVPDTTGGAIVSFAREGPYDVYVQRVDAAGTIQWTTTGVAACTASGTQSAIVPVGDGLEGVILAWQDDRNGTTDVYAQRVQALGTWGHPEPVVAAVTDVPADQGGRAGVEWLASAWDAPGFATITQYSLWREAPNSAVARTRSTVRQVEASQVGTGFTGPARRVVVRPDRTTTTWEFIATIPARDATQYLYTATTLADSTGSDPADEAYQVLAHTPNPFVFYVSNVLAGHSVDNLAPSAPVALTAQRAGADVHLQWDPVGAPDLRSYSIYRATSSQVAPVPADFLASTTNTSFVDPGVPDESIDYVVTATDVHGNEGRASNEATVPSTTAVGELPPIGKLAVLPSSPNPCSRRVDFRVGLPARMDLEVDLFDVIGRRVVHRLLPGMSAGWQTVSLEARDDESRPLASGIYSFRFCTGGSTVVRKVTIRR